MSMQTPPDDQSNTDVITAIVVMVGMTLAAIVAVSVVRPDADNTNIISSILTIMVPTTAALAAFLRAGQATSNIQAVHHQINSRMDQLVDLTATSSKAEGRLEGVASQQAAATPEELHNRIEAKWMEDVSKLERGK